ncbi:MAG: alpha/beta hydrolase [Dyadobacter sp.]|uniref:alpha/beta hydrolase n=1 Tax=Dyadobacter sp. TaxID=1914288 RepID=UPI003265D5C3
MKNIIFAFALILVFQSAHAQDEVIPLYSQSIPDSKTPPVGYVEQTDSSGLISQVTVPTLSAYFPAKKSSSRTAMIICPGGGYFVLSPKKCVEIARAFTEIGITAFVLKYRLPSDQIMKNKSIGPLQDAQTALKIIREKATKYGIDPDKVGMMGLSAGGHLVSAAGTQFDRKVIENKEGTSVRPDFIILLYPVTITDPQVPRTRENLIGKNPSPSALNFYSTNKHVTARTPPTFLIHALDDDVIPLKNSSLFFDALLKAGVKTEMHLIQSGGHGFGLYDLKTKMLWFELCRNWLTENGF